MATATTHACLVPSFRFCKKGNLGVWIDGSSKYGFVRGEVLRTFPLALSISGRRTISGTGVRASSAVTEQQSPLERFHLGNIGPQPGSRKRGKRKGRGIAAGQGASCGFGMRGQQSRSGPGVRRGFEGGHMPLYRRLPKLRGIAGGMPAGLPKFVSVNVRDIATVGFLDGDEVSLETLKSKRLINPSGRDRKLPLKILGNGQLNAKLAFKAGAFSVSAREKLEAMGCTLITLPGRKKWVKPSVTKHRARAAEYFAKKFSSNSS